jgi:hypothetical protein
MWTMTSKSMTSMFSTAMAAPRTGATLKLSTCLADGMMPWRSAANASRP